MSTKANNSLKFPNCWDLEFEFSVLTFDFEKKQVSFFPFLNQMSTAATAAHSYIRVTNQDRRRIENCLLINMAFRIQLFFRVTFWFVFPSQCFVVFHLIHAIALLRGALTMIGGEQRERGDRNASLFVALYLIHYGSLPFLINLNALKTDEGISP